MPEPDDCDEQRHKDEQDGQSPAVETRLVFAALTFLISSHG